MRPGDVFYLNGAYATLFKGNLILYEGFKLIIKGKQNIFRKINEFFFLYNDQINVSLKEW